MNNDIPTWKEYLSGKKFKFPLTSQELDNLEDLDSAEDEYFKRRVEQLEEELKQKEMLKKGR
jgi:hypothetical protein